MKEVLEIGRKREYGDWQTSLPLAISICEHIKAQGIRPQVVIEPTCGKGHFIIAALLTFDSIEDVFGIEIYKPYLDDLRDSLDKFGKSLEHVNVHLFHENIFDFDFGKIMSRINNKVVLAIGNPPWATNSKLSEISSDNLPVKTNFKKAKGLDAITGKANFDIAEYICTRLIDNLSSEKAYFSFLLKNSVVKNLVESLETGLPALSQIEQYNIDAQKEFNVSVAASLLFMHLFGRGERTCRVYDFYTKSSLYSFGWVGNKFVAHVDDYLRTKEIDGISPFVWRSGIKHDCSKVMELSRTGGRYVNGLGEIVDIEDDVIYPLLKSSDIKAEYIEHTRKYVLVTQHSTNEDTALLRSRYPKAYQYLIRHAEYLDGRKSSIYRGKPRFCMFGVGDYSFKKHKVVISGLYKQTRFSLVSEIEGKVAVCDDTCYLIGFDDYDVARLTRDILNSRKVQEFINSICFRDAKRVINKELLMRINLLPVLRQRLAAGELADEGYLQAAKYITTHSVAAMGQQLIDFDLA